MAQFPRLLANVIDAKAKTIPTTPWLLYAPSSLWEQEGGFRTITWSQFANAINKAALWLDENIPRETPGRETIAYLGPNDARYYILMVAVAKSKRTVRTLLFFHMCVSSDTFRRSFLFRTDESHLPG